MDIELLKSLGQGAGFGTIALLALIMLGRIVKVIGERMIAAIDKLIERIDEHTKTDVGALNELTNRMSRMEGKIDAVFEFTPVETPRPVPRAVGQVPRAASQGGYYPPRKPPRDDG